MKNYAIILASGSGSRFMGDKPKQFVQIGGKTIFEHSIEIFEQNERIDSIIIVVLEEYINFAQDIVAKNGYKKVMGLFAGGKTRQESSSIGVNSVPDEEANVLIHDCARPFLSQQVLNKCIDALKTHTAVNVAIPATDTIMQVENGFVKNVPDRNSLMCSQTPQCFRLSVIKKAHKMSGNFTDDCGLVLENNLADIFVVEGEQNNIKITYPSDVYIGNMIFCNNF
ncbi:2-C-methyl-D-erythritol 4-phosphate cytidylyltransferase [bacterium]|nr:2-C-methyl-D-erythritol 4-phosphate cytidylyltransferase [bacterium]